MPMTQEDIRRHYQTQWQQSAESATDVADLRFSNPVEDAIVYPLYETMIDDLSIRVNGGRVLDVGCGSGRWIRFFADRFSPELLMGIDYAASSIELLERWKDQASRAEMTFRVANITDADVGIEGDFDLINVGNVLFHVPEQNLFSQAMYNLAKLVRSGGRIVTTEYLPRCTMRTEWMLVRSRYEFESAAASVGLKIVDVRPLSFFSNDPMGVDGPDCSVRVHFNKVRAAADQIMSANLDQQSKVFFTNFLIDLERATLAFCNERIAPVDMPSQKLVVLARNA